MKNFIFLLCFLSTSFAFSQKKFSKSDHFLSVGYGVGTIGNWMSVYSSMPNYKSSNIGPFGLYYENAVTDKIGVSASLNYLNNKSSYNFLGYTNEISMTQLSVALRGAYHFKLDNKKFDPYAGAGLIYRKYTWSFQSDINQGSSFEFPMTNPMGIQLFAGGRYFITNNLGVFAEAGYGVSFLNFGATLAF